jgi:hypothetical protein
MRALASGDLRANRDNLTARWRIDSAALDDWLSMRTSVRHSPSSGVDTPLDCPETTPDASLDILRAERDDARLEAATLRAEAAQIRERLDETRTDRDHWRRMAERLSEPRPRRGLLGRLLGRSRPRPG